MDLGGSIEQFTSNTDAKGRAAYIESIEKSVKIVGTEYDYIVGDFLIRVSQVLTPTEAVAYQHAA